MSRLSIIILAILGLLLVGLLSLGFVNTEKQPVTVEKAMLNEAQAK